MAQKIRARYINPGDFISTEGAVHILQAEKVTIFDGIVVLVYTVPFGDDPECKCTIHIDERALVYLH